METNEDPSIQSKRNQRQKANSVLEKAENDVWGTLTKQKYSLWNEKKEEEYPSVYKLRQCFRETDIQRLKEMDSYSSLNNSTVTVVTGLTTRHTESDIKTALQKADEKTEGKLTNSKYEEWARSQDKLFVPDSTTIIHHSEADRWKDICANVDIETPEEEPLREGDFYQKFSDAEIKNAVTQAVDRFKEPLSRAEYQTWQSETDEEAPKPADLVADLQQSSWEAACDILDVDGITQSTQSRFSIRDIKTALTNVVEAKGEPLSKRGYEEYYNLNEHENSSSDGKDASPNHEAPSTEVIIEALANENRSGDWETACERIGIDIKAEAEVENTDTEEGTDYKQNDTPQKTPNRITEDNPEMFQQITTRVPAEHVKELETMIEEGKLDSRHQGVREAIRQYLS